MIPIYLIKLFDGLTNFELDWSSHAVAMIMNIKHKSVKL
jgi:hypothetical protein